MTAVSEDQLLAAVKALRVGLMTHDEDTANNPQELLSRLKDDHPMWKKGLDEPAVSAALKKIKDAEIPDYFAPPGLYLMDVMFSGRAMTELKVQDVVVVGIHHAQGGLGSKGSYILACKIDSTGRPGLMVMKESNPGFPSEVFASNVLRRLGIVAPKFRPLSIEEFRKFTWMLRSAQVTIKGTCSAIHNSGAQEGGGVLMEFLEGKILPEYEGPAFTNPKVLRDLGRCMAVDIVLNCLDRTPVVWDNGGNATNILVTDTAIHAIDNTYNRIDNKDLAKKHIDKVHACALEAKSGKIGPHAESIRKFVMKATSSRVNLDDAQLKIVFDALSEACDEISKNHKEIFESAARETREAFERVHSSSKAILDDCLRLDFCSQCAQAMLT